MPSHRILYLGLGMAALAIVSFQIGVYLVDMSGNQAAPTYLPCDQSTTILNGVAMIRVSLLINYGNGTLSWHNQTSVPSNWNAYSLTMFVTKCNVQSKFYGPPLNEHFVIGINGKGEEGGHSWSIWTFCLRRDAWIYSQVGADLVQLTSDGMWAWVYGTSSSQPPVPGATTANSCP